MTGNATVTPGTTLDATSIATSLVGAIANGTLDNTEGAAIGMTVPRQPTTVQQVVTPGLTSSSSAPSMAGSSSSTAGVDQVPELAEEDISSLPGGAIAGIVIGTVAGVALLIVVVFAVYSAAMSSLRGNGSGVAQANANDIKPKTSVEPRGSASVEMGATNKV